MNPIPRLLRACAAALALTGPVAAATLVIDPPEGSGRPGEAVLVRGSGYAVTSTVAIEIGGVPAAPGGLPTDADGGFGPVMVVLTGALPAGRLGAAVRGARAYEFKNAFQVRPVVTLDPPVGDGRPGATARTNKALPPGGHQGTVFTLAGFGFPAGLFIPADSLKLGKAATVHDPVTVGKDGVLPGTTVVATSALAPGRYDLSVPAAHPALVFASVFHAAPWAGQEIVRTQGTVKLVASVRGELRKLLAAWGEFVPPDGATDVDADLKRAEQEIKDADLERADADARGALDKIAGLKTSAQDAQRDKLKGIADVVASGLDTVQPAGAPPSPKTAQLVSQARKRLEDVGAALDKNDFEGAKTLLKAANELLKKARAEAGVKAAPDEQPIRW